MDLPFSDRKLFVISRRKNAVQVVYVDPKQFDDSIEHKVRFVQGANVFITFMLSYESIKVGYYFFYYMNSCKDFADMMIGFFVCNLLWVITSIIAFNSINSTRIKPVKYAYFTLGFIFVTRISLYVILGILMKPFFVESASGEQPKTDCALIYQPGLYILQASGEGVLLIILYFYVRSIYQYLKQKDVDKFFIEHQGN